GDRRGDRPLPAEPVRADPAGGGSGRDLAARLSRLPGPAPPSAGLPNLSHRSRLPRRWAASRRGRARARAARSGSEARRRGRGRRRGARVPVRTGILGGIFAPPHNGHLALARAAFQQLAIEKLVVLVAADPGHRRVFAAPEDRLRLAQAAFEDLPAEV